MDFSIGEVLVEAMTSYCLFKLEELFDIFVLWFLDLYNEDSITCVNGHPLILPTQHSLALL